MCVIGWHAVTAGGPVMYTYTWPSYYCADVYYEQQMQGNTVVYLVVNP